MNERLHLKPLLALLISVTLSGCAGGLHNILGTSHSEPSNTHSQVENEDEVTVDDDDSYYENYDEFLKANRHKPIVWSGGNGLRFATPPFNSAYGAGGNGTGRPSFILILGNLNDFPPEKWEKFNWVRKHVSELFFPVEFTSIQNLRPYKTDNKNHPVLWTDDSGHLFAAPEWNSKFGGGGNGTGKPSFVIPAGNQNDFSPKQLEWLVKHINKVLVPKSPDEVSK